MRSIVAVAAMLLMVACSGPRFERDDAAKLISETEQVSALGQHISTYQGYLADGEAQGLWTTETSRDPVINATVSQQIARLGADFVQPTAPAPITVTVTGMTEIPDDGTVTSAEFEWHYADLPKYIKRFAQAGGTGQASFQKFDDGWRISSVSFSRTDSRVEPSEAEMAEAKEDFAKETARRNAITERIRASFAQGNPIKSYDVDYYGAKHRYVIHPNGVAYHSDTVVNGRYTGKLVQSSFVWFGQVFNLREGGWGVQYNTVPDQQINPQSFMTTYYKMDTKDFLATVTAAHAAWTKKYSDLPINLRNKVYVEERSVR